MTAIEREVESAILAQKRWADLEHRMRDLIGSSQEYDKKILSYSIENQLRYRGNLVRFVVNDEYDYYIELLKYSRDNLMLFPYHLSDFIITGMRITPFQYYLSTMTQIIEQEKSYDTLPNFTAADCLRLLGIGRNQYIDIMNELRSTYRRFLGIGVKRNARSLLPNKPDKNVPIEPWWFINAGYITEDDVRSMVTPAERNIIDRLVSPDGMSNQILACDLDKAHVRSLYIKGLVYLDVPIYDDDYIVLPPLEGFVMNRVTGDYIETLLYKIFVSLDQSTPVQELAKILEIDIRLVKDAISMYCRLGFAYKKNIYIDMNKCHSSWRETLENYCKMGINVSQQQQQQQQQQVSTSSRQVSDFINELASVEDNDLGTVIGDGPAAGPEPEQHSGSNHIPQSPSSILSAPGSVQFGSLALVTGASQQETGPASAPASKPAQPGAKKIVFFYDSNLAAFLMMGNLSSKLKNHAVTMFEVGKLSDEWIDSLLCELRKIKADALEDDGYEAKRYYIHAVMLQRTIEFIRSDLRLDVGPAPSDNATLCADAPGEQQQQQHPAAPSEPTRVGLDLIRVESLSNLDSESCERFLKKNYQLIISVAPLNQDVKLNAASSLPHLGPGSPLINSLWFRLYIYHITAHGPSSLLLVQGYRLRALPSQFLEHDTLLINHWNREPTCVSTNNALNAINEALTHSPVLLQAYPIQPAGGNLINSDEKVFVPLPLLEWPPRPGGPVALERPSGGGGALGEAGGRASGAELPQDLNSIPAIGRLNEQLSLNKICGYITLLRSAQCARRLAEQQQQRDSGCLGYDLRRKADPAGQEQQPATPPPPPQAEGEPQADELTLFDCHFGIPLFDKFLNKQVRGRIGERGLCAPNMLGQLVEITRRLNQSVASFVEEHRASRAPEGVERSNSGDQRHFFAFPNTEQFACTVPRPAQNLLFHAGRLAEFAEPD